MLSLLLRGLVTSWALFILVVFSLVSSTCFSPKSRDQNHDHAQDYKDVGKVERRPMPGLPMEIQVIDNVASKNSVDDIS